MVVKNFSGLTVEKINTKLLINSENPTSSDFDPENAYRKPSMVMKTLSQKPRTICRKRLMTEEGTLSPETVFLNF